MRVSQLLLEDFRSYARAELAIGPGVTAFIGSNGAGKTNLLEAIHLLARGDSPRAGAIRIFPVPEKLNRKRPMLHIHIRKDDIVQILTGEDKGKTQKGIYKVEADKAKLAYFEDKTPNRPTELASKACCATAAKFSSTTRAAAPESRNWCSSSDWV